MRKCETFTICDLRCDRCGRQVMKTAILDNILLVNNDGLRFMRDLFSGYLHYNDLPKGIQIESKDLCEPCRDYIVEQVKKLFEPIKVETISGQRMV